MRARDALLIGGGAALVAAYLGRRQLGLAWEAVKRGSGYTEAEARALGLAEGFGAVIEGVIGIQEWLHGDPAGSVADAWEGIKADPRLQERIRQLQEEGV